MRAGTRQAWPNLVGASVLLIFAALLFSSQLALAQSVFTQQGPKLVGTGAVDSFYGVQQGSSVALSVDGNTAIVGGLSDKSDIGAAWVYTRSLNAWTQQGSKLFANDAVGSAEQGHSVALSADGNTAIVSGPGDSVSTGAAWVFTRSGGVWTQQGPKLVAHDAVGNASQGTSVALSGDGNTAIVGGQGDNGGVGAAWVYTRSGGAWNQQGNKLVANDAVGTALQGASVALSADGNTAMVGGPGYNSYAGAAWVYTRSGGVWTQQGPKLVGTLAVGAAEQGVAVALSHDGNTALVGGVCRQFGHRGGMGLHAQW
jgi:FG-GAP repeat